MSNIRIGFFSCYDSDSKNNKQFVKDGFKQLKFNSTIKPPHFLFVEGISDSSKYQIGSRIRIDNQVFSVINMANKSIMLVNDSCGLKRLADYKIPNRVRFLSLSDNGNWINIYQMHNNAPKVTYQDGKRIKANYTDTHIDSNMASDSLKKHIIFGDFNINLRPTIQDDKAQVEKLMKIVNSQNKGLLLTTKEFTWFNPAFGTKMYLDYAAVDNNIIKKTSIQYYGLPTVISDHLYMELILDIDLSNK